MTPKRALALLLLLALAALVGVGLAQTLGSRQGSEPLAMLTPAQMRSRLVGSPAPLASLHAQANKVLGGGASALPRRLAALSGYPVVLNKWASWCAPCRAEFRAFQHAAVDYGRQVAFVGVDSGDMSRASAAAFLRSSPVSYPSYYDPSGQLGLRMTDSSFTPVTVFIAKDGQRYIHQGQYPSLAKLERDIRRYALHV